MHSQAFIDEMKQKLLAAKEQLSAELKNLQPHTDMGDDEDENAEEVNVDEVNRDAAAIIQRDLEKIEKALQKIQDGTYGVDDAGKEISEERLRALPWADRAL